LHVRANADANTSEVVMWLLFFLVLGALCAWAMLWGMR
jgi:hypothetical protein